MSLLLFKRLIFHIEQLKRNSIFLQPSFFKTQLSFIFRQLATGNEVMYSTVHRIIVVRKRAHMDCIIMAERDEGLARGPNSILLITGAY